MPKVTIAVENLEPWMRRIDGADKIIREEITSTLTSMGAHLKPLVQDKTPTDTGKLKRAIDFKVEKVRAGVYRMDLGPGGIKYAVFVERGTRPHWPPISALEAWAQRHGIPAFLVARAIARHGTIKRFGRPGPAGAEMFEKTFKDEEGWIQREGDRMGERIVQGIVKS